MKIGINRDRLEDLIYKELYKINLDKDNKDRAYTALIDKGYLPGDAQQIIAGNTALEPMSDIHIGLIADVFYKITENQELNPEKYFDEKELERIKYLEVNIIEDEIKLPIIFKNMQKYNDNMWVGIISIDKFVRLHQSGISTYNFETQRDPIYKKYEDTMIKKVNINPNSVKEISEKILNGTYLYDDITLNILDNGKEDFEFNKISENIGDIIFNSGYLNLTDGAHRLKGAESALLKAPNTNGYFILVITNFDINRANDYIRQKDKRNEINKEYLESKNMESLSNAITKNINESSTSDLKGLILTDKFLLKQGRGVALFSTMSKVIDKLWAIDTRREVRIITKYLIEFFNELIGIFPDELKNNIKHYRNQNYINHPNMIIYYLTIASIIQQRDNWRDLLYAILTETNFKNDNILWKETIEDVNTNNINNRLNKIIKKYEGIVSERMF